MLLLFIVSLAGGASASENPVVSREVLEDRTGQLTIHDAASQPYDPAGPVLSKGYTDSTHWLRIKVEPPQPGEPLVLRIRPAVVDEITLFAPDPEHPGVWQQRVAGDRHPFAQRDPPSLAPSFRIQPSATGTTYYLRLKTSGASLLHVEAITPAAAARADAIGLIYQALYLGVMLWLLFWSLNDYLAQRGRVSLWFGLYVGLAILHDLGARGFFVLWAPAGWPELADHLTSFMLCAAALALLAFHRRFLLAYGPPRWTLILLNSLMAGMALALIALWAGQARLVLQFNAYLDLLMPPLFLWLMLLARREAAPPRRTVLRVYGLLTVIVLLVVAPILGWAGPALWHLDSSKIEAVVAAGLGFLLVRQRSLQRQNERQRLRQELALTHQHIALERAQREEQRQFMSMLSHELKTPMGIVRLALDTAGLSDKSRARTDRAVRDMAAIIDLCLQTGQLEEGGYRPVREACQVADLLQAIVTQADAAARIEWHIDPVPPCPTDGRLLRIVIANLLDNALKYAAPDTPIGLRLTLASQEATLGIRLSIANVPGRAGWPDTNRVFTKYYRGRRAQSQTGSGLGLYLVRVIADRLRATVAYRPEAARVVFEFWLPLPPEAGRGTPEGDCAAPSVGFGRETPAEVGYPTFQAFGGARRGEAGYPGKAQCSKQTRQGQPPPAQRMTHTRQAAWLSSNGEAIDA